MRVEYLIEGVHEILQQVKPIGNLGGLRRLLAGSVSIGSGPDRA
jgi:hypothetical protein